MAHVGEGEERRGKVSIGKISEETPIVPITWSTIDLQLGVV
jgi:hypothetical protein